ncbi:MAG: hypothetical protein QXQ87_04935 [Halobacteria archaeon]
MADAKRDPFEEWHRMNGEIVQRGKRWSQTRVPLLELVGRLDDLRRSDRIDEGAYRQKGNLFRDTVQALVTARCGVRLKDTKVDGRTDRHDLDFAGFQDEKGTIVVMAGEAKMLGSPPHIRAGKEYGERTISIDIDKRLKEVKYTPIDLKRHQDSEIRKGWTQWLEETQPKFFSAWLCRLAARDRLDRVIRKLEGLREYNNGVGVAIYRESGGRYEWVDVQSKKLADMDGLVDLICRAMGRQ